MKRIVKEPGVGNIELVDTPIPEPGPDQVLVKVHRSLISRGSEIGGRFRKSEAVSPDIMGYSAAGEIVEVGDDVDSYQIGQRVIVGAPHAEFVLGNTRATVSRTVTPIPSGMSYDEAVFQPLATGAVLWTDIAQIAESDDVVVMGLGLVGNLCLQAAKRFSPRQLIGVDAIQQRCQLAEQLGAHKTIDVSQDEPVVVVERFTGDRGASLVMECVGGPAGVRSFEQAVQMTRPLGRIHLIALYHEQPLQLDSQAIQRKTIIGGYVTDLEQTRRPAADTALQLISSRDIDVEPLVTHHVSPSDARRAFELLHDHRENAFGVIFDWT